MKLNCNIEFVVSTVLATLFSTVFLFVEPCFSMPQIGDSATWFVVTARDGKTTDQKQMTSTFVAYESARDLYVLDEITRTSNGSSFRSTYSVTGTSLSELESSKVSLMAQCENYGWILQTITLASGQLIDTCKYSNEYSDNYTVQTNESLLPWAEFVRTESTQMIRGTIIKTIKEMTTFTLNSLTKIH